MVGGRRTQRSVLRIYISAIKLDKNTYSNVASYINHYMSTKVGYEKYEYAHTDSVYMTLFSPFEEHIKHITDMVKVPGIAIREVSITYVAGGFQISASYLLSHEVAFEEQWLQHEQEFQQEQEIQQEQGFEHGFEHGFELEFEQGAELELRKQFEREFDMMLYNIQAWEAAFSSGILPADTYTNYITDFNTDIIKGITIRTISH